jgi:hypothetical protein
MRLTHHVGVLAMLAALTVPATTANAGQDPRRAQVATQHWSHGRGRSDLAYTNGFNDGYREGLNDGRHRHRNDPYAESRYRSGDHGFERWYGSREEYRWHYRDAFRSGYERGFADAWHR